MYEPERETLLFKEHDLDVTLEHYDLPYDSTDMKWKGRLTTGKSWCRGSVVDIPGTHYRRWCVGELEFHDIAEKEEYLSFRADSVAELILIFTGNYPAETGWVLLNSVKEPPLLNLVGSDLESWLKAAAQEENRFAGHSLFCNVYSGDVALIPNLHGVVEELQFIQQEVVGPHGVRQEWV